MRRNIPFLLAGCLFFATVYAGCVFTDEECDYIETECWDVVDVYCDAWGCWEDWYTECVDYCVDVADPPPSPECLEDYHCPDGQICDEGRCVWDRDQSGGGGLCQPCQTNADCVEPGALCLNLTADAETGYCGRGCDGNEDCPVGFECLAISGDDARQCVPESRQGVRSCEGLLPYPVECQENRDCQYPLVCEQGRCVAPTSPECTTTAQCDPGETCVGGACVPTTIECTSNLQCDQGEECVDGRCQAMVIECQRNEECHGGVCVDGQCRSTCDNQNDCPQGQVCLGGLCSPPPEPECLVGSDCEGEGQFYCVNGSCRNACETDEDCDDGYYCQGFYCDIDPTVECRTNLECGLNERCVQGECLVPCITGCDCPVGLSCAEDGFCRDLPLPESCDDPCDCPGGYTCIDSTCQPVQS